MADCGNKCSYWGRIRIWDRMAGRCAQFEMKELSCIRCSKLCLLVTDTVSHIVLLCQPAPNIYGMQDNHVFWSSLLKLNCFHSCCNLHVCPPALNFLLSNTPKPCLGQIAALAVFEFWFPLFIEGSHAFLLILQCKA